MEDREKWRENGRKGRKGEFMKREEGIEAKWMCLLC